MNISKRERKLLDMLAMGGRIIVETDDKSRIIDASFISREGWFLDGVGHQEFRALKSKRFVLSRNGGDYRISRQGIEALQAARRG